MDAQRIDDARRGRTRPELKRTRDLSFDRTSRRCAKKERVRPILFTNFLLRSLLDSVAVFARDSSTITSITFDGIPLTLKYLNILCWGLKDNEKLRNLSLAKCRIGDVGCNLLLGSLRNVPNLCVLNLSSCRLTNRSATFLSLFLKRKKADLLQNVWETSSLKSCEENCNKVHGLRTLILNKNPKFGDGGMQQLIYVLKTDFWLKCLSMKKCGISKYGGEIVIKLLQSNTSITKMDLTENHIPINTLQMIFRMLKRKRESTENTTLKKKLGLNWKCSQNKLCRNKNDKSSKRNGKCPINRPNETTKDSSTQNNRLKIVRFDKKIGQARKKKTEKDPEKKNNSQRDKLHDLESQLLSIIESNSKLKEQLLSNKALLNMEAQETLRMEDELQKMSCRLNDIRNKVVTLNKISSKTSSENQLISGLRYAFEKIQELSIAATGVDAEEEIVLNETETT